MEPLDPISKMAQFTPQMGLNRDALMYAAGRASMPRVWPWRWAVLGSICTQAAMAWWLWPTSPSQNVPMIVTQPTAEPAVPEQPPLSITPTSILWFQRTLSDPPQQGLPASQVVHHQSVLTVSSLSID